MILFFIIAPITVFAAVMVVTRKSPLASAIYLVLVMCCIAGLFAMLGALFIAAMQVIVYAGAIMVLVIFVIMLLNLRDDEFGYDKRVLQKYLGLAFALLIMVQAVFIIGWAMTDYPEAPSEKLSAEVATDSDIGEFDNYMSAESVAETLFLKFAYPFEVTSILLLTAIIGAMIISQRKRHSEEEGEEV